MSHPSIKLTYFDIEGAAEPIRLALALVGTEYEDVRLSSPEWAEFKNKTPYGQLPVMSIDGGPYKTQSGAMLRWVATLDNNKRLYPTEKLYEVEEAIGLIGDMDRSLAPATYIAFRSERFGYPKGFGKTEEGMAKTAEMRKGWVAGELPKFLGFIEDRLEKNGGKWLVDGESPTIADCAAIPSLRKLTRGHIDHIDPSCLESHPNIVAYVKCFCDLPEIKGRYTDGLY